MDRRRTTRPWRSRIKLLLAGSLGAVGAYVAFSGPVPLAAAAVALVGFGGALAWSTAGELAPARRHSVTIVIVGGALLAAGLLFGVTGGPGAWE